MQKGPAGVFGVRPLDQVQPGDGGLAAAPDVLRDGVARADVAAEEGGVDAGV